MDRAKIYNRSAAILLIKRHAVKDYNLTGVMFLPKSREGDGDGDCCILIVFSAEKEFSWTREDLTIGNHSDLSCSTWHS